jgi:hypothetical protein
MVQGALLCPDLPSQSAGLVLAAWYAALLWPIGQQGAPAVAPGLPRYPVSRLICGRASPACRGSGSRLTPHCRSVHGGTRSTGTRWPGAPARTDSWPTRRRTRRAKVGTFQCGRSSMTGPARRSAAGSGRRPAGPYQPDGLPAVQMRRRAPARASQRSDEVADRVVLDNLAKLAAQLAGDGEQPAARRLGILVGRADQAGLRRAALARTAPHLSA